MKKLIIGALAHVDAGKTTLSESLLFKSGEIRKSGRVDHQDAFLDYSELEKEKGITIFNKEARFTYADKEFIYVDTPGHNDLRYEANRALRIIDLAIIILSANDEIPSDTISQFNHLCDLNIPTIIFVNKMDNTVYSQSEIIEKIQNKFNKDCLINNDIPEMLAMEDDDLLEEYLNTQSVPDTYYYNSILNNYYFPVFFGSALKNEGIDELLSFLVKFPIRENPDEGFKAYVYKISTIDGQRFTHLKVLSGTLYNKSSFGDEKINEIYILSGQNMLAVSEVKAGDLCVVKGLKTIEIGTYLPSFINDDEQKNPALTYRLLFDGNAYEVFKTIKVLNDENPELNIRLFDENIYLDLSGILQSEIIKHDIAKRFNINVDYSDPIIIYKESITDEVYGVGHFEPLRHYAEVVVKLKPIENAMRFKSLKNDSYTGPLMNYLKTYPLYGLLTNSELCNLEITIVDYKTHIKHTEGQDLFEALKRAIRQGLTKAKGILLEPFYVLTIDALSDNLNKIIAELGSYTYTIEDNAIICKIPQVAFNSFVTIMKSKLKDSFSYKIENIVYDECLNSQEIIEQKNYHFEDDFTNPAGSIFTKNGAGHYVSYQDVEDTMHLNMADYTDKVYTSIKHNKSTINEEELKRVWNSLYKPKERFYLQNKAKVISPKYEYKQSLPLIYLIDGYNLMFMLNENTNDLINGRQQVIDIVCDFAGYVQAECVLVFDAYNTNSQINSISEYDNITLVYTRNNVTADTYIENKAKELENKYKVIVVTSDYLEQLRSFYAGASRLSSREFLDRYERFRKNSQKISSIKNRPLENLRELLLESDDE